VPREALFKKGSPIVDFEKKQGRIGASLHSFRIELACHVLLPHVVVNILNEGVLTMKLKKRSGFTLLEIMIVVTIIGLLLAVAIPAYARSRQTTQSTLCVNNMRKIEAAKDQWSIENFKSIGYPCVSSDIIMYFKNGFPMCPANGDYTVNAIGSNVTCSISGKHVII
jgi:prepilin-type N-terminal cleavage/methylation domain-containing protein